MLKKNNRLNLLFDKVEKINKRVKLIEKFFKWYSERDWKFFLSVVIRDEKREKRRREKQH